MSAVRARRAGEVLGSGIGTAGVERRVEIAPCPAVSGAADPIGAIASRLEAAGSCLLALPERGYSPHLRITRYEVVRSALDAYGWEASRIRPPHPSGAEIDRMDEALGWLAAIPEERFVLRRILGARALTHPLTGRHLFPWRRLGGVLGADHKSVQRWHREGLGIVLAALVAAERKLAESRASR
ncbi:DUF6362 family protein [Acidiphilium sp.]|uniref:DUF6362 family protein n=1 Tax=Acidiphilium sp. TaxID=527 RepID=UPI00258960F3|nr:DUF6362 family protein [Acidiphilium sp.]